VNLKSTLSLLMVAGLLVGAAWWLWPTRQELKTTPAMPPPSSPSETTAVPSDPPPPDEIPAEAEATEIDPQSEVRTAVTDYLGRLQRGDMVGLVKNYTPPATLEQPRSAEGAAAALAMYDAMKQNPQLQRILEQNNQRKIAELQSIQEATPIYDDTGNRATYALPADSTKPSIVFVRVNDRWYREQ
jgi:hypothetical protein